MVEAIQHDDIVWHANAVNWLTEIADAQLFGYGLDLRTRLNKRFNKTHGATAGKLTDTTGMSRSTITTLNAHGVTAFHVGYNGVGGLPIMGLPAPFQVRSQIIAPLANAFCYCRLWRMS